MIRTSNRNIAWRCQWAVDRKFGNSPKHAVDRQATAMPVDNMFHNGKSKTHTANLVDRRLRMAILWHDHFSLGVGCPSTSHKRLVINHFGTAICRYCKINEPALTVRIKQATHRWINVQLHYIWLAFKPDIFQILACSSTEDQRKAQGKHNS